MLVHLNKSLHALQVSKVIYLHLYRTGSKRYLYICQKKQLFETYTESSLSTNHTDHTCIMMIDINIRQNKEANFEDVFFSI